MKTKALKEKDLHVLRDEFAATQDAFVVQFQGLTVVAVDELRRKVREADGTYRVVKNTLARKASENTAVAGLAVHFRGPTALVVARKDPARIAKVLTEFAKANPMVLVRAGVVEGTVLDGAGCKALSELPSKDELFSKLLFLINAPAQRLVTVMNATGRNLAYVISEGMKKKA